MTESITINKTWHGEPSVHNYFINLSISSSSGDIVIQIDAPFFNDPKPDQPPGRVSDLYNYEVVELFFSGIPYDMGAEVDCPYLEIEIGPYSHYLLAFFLREGDFENVDTSLQLENIPNISIDFAQNRWKAEVMIPFYMLPEPSCGEDLSVSWNFNAYAIHGNTSHREFLAYSPVPGDAPNFHQLQYFQHIELYETVEIRTNVNRSQSIANDKLAKIPLKNDNNPNNRLGQLKEDEEDEIDENDTLEQKPLASPASSPKSFPLTQNPQTVEDIAKQLKSTIESIPDAKKFLELEEKFQRHIQSDEFVILHEYLWKRKGISYKKRKLILTSKPRLIYFDPNGVYKGFIQWSMTKRLQLIRVSCILFIVEGDLL